MQKYVTYKGIIKFDPEDVTKKHIRQSEWKKISMIFFDGDLLDYYGWFVYKRYGVKLNKSVRNPHVTLINDSYRDIKSGLKVDSDEIVNLEWDRLKSKWDNEEISVTFDLDIISDYKYWWLRVSYDKREEMHNIRQEIGLDKPFFGFHMTIGHINEQNYNHSVYIVNSAMKFEYPIKG
ncbi:MAG: hypothetical protein KDH96_12140 [Candidatus Riesia sp.]|nr:hypothetical protein [Candidatus Riesia sp.]